MLDDRDSIWVVGSAGYRRAHESEVDGSVGRWIGLCSGNRMDTQPTDQMYSRVRK